MVVMFGCAWLHIGRLVPDVADHPGRNAGHDCEVRHVMGHNRTRPDHCPQSDLSAADDRRIRPDGGAMPDQRRITSPIPRALHRTIGIGAAWKAVIREHDAVADEDFILDRHALAKERMRGDLAPCSDRAFPLDFHERTYATVLTDAAPVKIHQIRVSDPNSAAYVATNHRQDDSPSTFVASPDPLGSLDRQIPY